MGFFKRDKTSTLEAVANAPVGSPVLLGGENGSIIGTLVFSASGDHWIEHLVMVAGGRRVWVSIENFDTTVGTQWDLANPAKLSGGHDDARAEYDGVVYSRSEAGHASFVAHGDPGCDENGSIDFIDFGASDGRRLGFERYGEVGARRRSIAVMGNCPNCGAGLQTDGQGRCKTCGASATVDEGQWGEWEVCVGTDVTNSLRLA